MKFNKDILRRKAGFSLIELLIVIAILGILSVAGIGLYTSSLGKSRDARRKSDLSTIQKALESYYNDYGTYPASTASSNLCADTTHCYLRTTPVDPNGPSYYYIRGNVSGTNQSFQIYSAIERSDDSGTGVNQLGYSGTSCNGSLCKYGVSSTNTTP